MRSLFLVCFLLLLSCSSLKHYRKVATDTEVTPEKKAIIAPWVSAHFPQEIIYLQGEEVIVLDSTFNQAIIDSLIASVDSLTSSTTKINIDSLKEAIRKECVPRIVYKTKMRVDTVKVPDKAAIFVLQRDLDVANAANVALAAKLKESEDKLEQKNKKRSNFIIYLVLAGAVVIFQAYLLVKPKK